MKDSNLYIARVLSFDSFTKDAFVLVPQLQGQTPLSAQAYIANPSELTAVTEVIPGDRVLVFFDGGDLDSQVYWLAPNSTDVDLSAYYTGTYIDTTFLTQADAANTYLTETDLGVDLGNYYTKTAADALFLTQTDASTLYVDDSELATALSDYYTQTAVNNIIADYLPLSGNPLTQMTGHIWLVGSPTDPLHPVTYSMFGGHVDAANPHPDIQVALATNTTGSYVESISGTTNQVNVTGGTGEQSTPVLSLPQNIHTAATPTFTNLTLSQVTGTAPLAVNSTTVVTNFNADRLDGQHGAYYQDWNNATNKPDPTISVAVTGAVSGSDSQLWTDLSGNVSLSIATTLNMGPGSLLNADFLDGFDSSHFLDASNLNAGSVPDARLTGPYTFDLTGALTGNASTATALAAPFTIAGFSTDGTTNVTLATLTAGNYLTGGTYNGSTGATFAVDASTTALANKIVARDASGDINANVITGLRFTSTVAEGTAPLTVASSTLVTNLNADKLDGEDATYFASQAELESLLGDLLYVGLYDAASYDSGAGTGFPAPQWDGGPTTFRHAMYWVVSSNGVLDFIDSDLSGRYDIDDLTAEVANGDWIIVTDPNVGTNGIGVDIVVPDVAAAIAAGTINFQYIPFSAETFVKSQIALHAEDAEDPHAAAGYLKVTDTDLWYAPKTHDHNDDIEQYVAQHGQRTTYTIDTFGIDGGELSLWLTSANQQMFTGTEVTVDFPPGEFFWVTGSYTVLRAAADGSVVLAAPDLPDTPTQTAPYEGTPGTGIDPSGFTGLWLAADDSSALDLAAAHLDPSLRVGLAKVTAEPHPYYLLSTLAEELYASSSHNHDGDISAAITVHVQEVDPHPQYLNTDRGDNRYEELGAVTQHRNEVPGDLNLANAAHSDWYYTKDESDARYSFESALQAHIDDPDPHPDYLQESEADGLYAPKIHNHADLYYEKQEIVDLIAEATPPELIATDSAASALLYVGNVTPSNPQEGDLWIETVNVNLTEPSLPVGFSLVSLSESSIQASWNAWPAAAALTGVRLQWSSTGNAGTYVDVPPGTPLAASATSYVHTGLDEDTTYYYRLSGENSINDAAADDPLSPPPDRYWVEMSQKTNNLTPPAPTNPVITNPQPTEFTLSWTDPTPWPDPGTSGNRYEVALTGTDPIDPVPNSITTTSYTFTGLTEVTTYQPKVRVVDRGGLASNWLQWSATTTNADPPEPAGIATPVADSGAPKVSVTWTAYAGSIPDFAWYEAQLIDAGNSAVLHSTTVASAGNGSWTTPETTFGRSVQVRVRTVDASGAVSAWVTSAAVSTRADVVGAPTSSGGSPGENFTASWSGLAASAATLTGFSGYEVQLWVANGGSATSTVSTNTSTTSYQWTNLSFGTQYTARVRVKRSSGTAPAWGTYSTVRTMLANPIPGVSASASSNTVTGTVSAPATVGDGFIQYVIALYTSAGSYVGAQFRTSAGSVTWTGLSYSTSYKVRAYINRSPKNSSWSGYTGNVTTSAPPDTTPPALPTDLIVSVSGGYGVMYGFMNWPGDSAHVEIMKSINGGSWSYVHTGSPINTVGLGTYGAGTSIRMAARSRDANNNWSGWAYSNTRTLVASPILVLASGTNYWRNTSGGQYNADGLSRPIQGYYSNPAYNAVGMYYYGNNIINACAGKTVIGMTVDLFRYNGGGNNAADAIYVGIHNDTTNPGTVSGWGSPNVYSISSLASLAWGQASGPWMTTTQWQALAYGSARGVGLYASSGKPYVIMESIWTQVYSGAVRIYHYG